MDWDLVHKYRYYVASLGLIIVIAIFFIAVSFNNYAQSQDVILMTQLKQVSYSLESYYGQHWSYPEASNLNLSQDLVLTDKGFEADRSKIYYQGKVTAGKASYSSDSSGYQIKFHLRSNWSVVGTKGKNCVISQNYQISCGK